MASTRYSMILSDLPFSHKMLIGNEMKILRICKLLGGFTLCEIFSGDRYLHVISDSVIWQILLCVVMLFRFNFSLIPFISALWTLWLYCISVGILHRAWLFSDLLRSNASKKKQISKEDMVKFSANLLKPIANAHFVLIYHHQWTVAGKYLR